MDEEYYITPNGTEFSLSQLHEKYGEENTNIYIQTGDLKKKEESASVAQEDDMESITQEEEESGSLDSSQAKIEGRKADTHYLLNAKLQEGYKEKAQAIRDKRAAEDKTQEDVATQDRKMAEAKEMGERAKTRVKVRQRQEEDAQVGRVAEREKIQEMGAFERQQYLARKKNIEDFQREQEQKSYDEGEAITGLLKQQLEKQKIQKDKDQQALTSLNQQEEQKKKQLEENVDYLSRINNVNFDDLPEQGKKRADFINKNFGDAGFISIPQHEATSGALPGMVAQTKGGNILISDINGNPLTVDLDKPEDVDLLKDFLQTNASFSQPEENESVAVKKARQFWEDKGYNYNSITNANENYKDLGEKADLIEKLVDPELINIRSSLYTEEDIKQYPELFVTLSNGAVVPTTTKKLKEIANNTEEQYDKLSEVVGFSADNRVLLETTEDFDKYMSQERQQSLAKAVLTNDVAKEQIDNALAEAERFYGVPINEVNPKEFTNRGQFEVFDKLVTDIESAELTAQEAAKLYQNSRTFWDLKMDKAITSKTTENLDAFTTEFSKGLDRGYAMQVLIWRGLGLDPSDLPTDVDDRAEAIAKHLGEAEEKGTSLQMLRLERTRGAKEYLSTVAKDPLETMGTFFASSISQMLPFGWKLILGGGAAGATTAATYAAATGNPFAVGGAALSGLVTGVTGGFAAANGMVEYGNALLESATKYQYDPLVPDQWKMAMEDERVWTEARNIGLARGIPIAVVDFLTLRLGGRLFGTASRAFAGNAAKSAMIAAEVAFQPLGEGAGELAAQISRIKLIGDQRKIAWKDVSAETFGSAGGLVANPIQQSALAHNFYNANSTKAKLELAETLTDIRNINLQKTDSKKIMDWVDNMKSLGQIDDDTYTQIRDNVSARDAADQVIKMSNPDLVIAEEKAESDTPIGEEQVRAIKKGKITTTSPLVLLKGTVGKVDAEGKKKTRHPNVKAPFATLEKEIAEEYSRTEEGPQEIVEFNIPEGSTIEVIEIEREGLTPAEYNAKEEEAINASDADVVKLITFENKSFKGSMIHEQYVIKNQTPKKEGIISKALGGIKNVLRKNNIRNRVAELIRAREILESNKETRVVNSDKIAAINKEIGEIVNTGKLLEKPTALPALGQTFIVNGKKYTQAQIIKYLETRPLDKFTKDQVILRNAPAFIQDKLTEKNKQLNLETDAIQKQSTEGVDVGKQATDGPAMGVGDTQKQEVAPETEEEVKDEEKELSEETQSAVEEEGVALEKDLADEEKGEMTIDDLLDDLLKEEEDTSKKSKLDNAKRIEKIGGMTPAYIIETALSKGYTNESIKYVIKKYFPDLKVAEIEALMAINITPKLGIFKRISDYKSFGNVLGGILEGMEMVADIVASLKSFNVKNDKTPKQLSNHALKTLKLHPGYTNITGNTALQKQLQIDLLDLMRVPADIPLMTKLATLQEQIKNIEKGGREFKAVVTKLKSILRQEVDAKVIKKGEYNKALTILGRADFNKKDALMNDIIELVEKVQERQKKELLKKTEQDLTKLAKVKRSQGGRTISLRRLDPLGQKFFQAAKVVFHAIVRNQEARLKKLKDTLFNIEDGIVVSVKPEVEKAIEAYEADGDITQKQLNLVFLHSAYDLFKDINTKSYSEVKDILGKQLGVLDKTLKDVEKESRSILATKIYARAKKNRILKAEANEVLSKTFTGLIYDLDAQGNIKYEYTKLTGEERTSFEAKVLKALKGKKEGLIEIKDEKGNTLKFKVQVNKEGETIIEIGRPLVLNENQQVDRWRTTYDKIKLSSGKTNRAKAIWDITKDFIKQFRDKNTYIKFFSNVNKYNIMGNLKTYLTLFDSVNNNFFVREIFYRLNDMGDQQLREYYNSKDFVDALANKIFDVKNGLESVQESDIADRGYDITMLDGKEKRFSGGNLMYIYAQSLNKESNLMLLGQNNEGKQIRKSEFTFSKDSLKQIEKELGTKNTEFIKGVVDYLSNVQYEKLNQVYEDVNYVSLPRTENYFPRLVSKQETTKETLNPNDFMTQFNTQYHSLLKDRVSREGEILVNNISFFAALDKNLSDASRFIAYAEGTKDMNAIFQSESFTAAMKVSGSESIIAGMINGAVNPTSLNNALNGDNLVNRLLSAYVLGKLAVKTAQIIKQAASFIVAFQEYDYNPTYNPTTKRGQALKTLEDALYFSADALELAVNWKQNYREAKRVSPTFRARVEEGDVYSLESGRIINRTGKSFKKFDRVLGYMTRVGDIMGVMGYFINYKRDVKNKMDSKKAISKFNRYNETQQTRRLEDLNRVQLNKNPYAKIVTAFASVSMLQLNNVIQSSYNMFLKGDYSRKNVRSFVLNLGLANGLFYIAGNFLKFFGDEEDKEQFATELMLYMSGMYMFESSMVYLGSAFGAANQFFKGEVSPYRDTMINPARDVVQALQALQDDKIRTKSQVETAMLRIASSVSVLFKVNIDPFVALHDLSRDLYKGDDFSGRDVAKIFGFPNSGLPDEWKKGRYEFIRWYNYKLYKDIIKMQEDIKKLTIKQKINKAETIDETRKILKEHLNKKGRLN